MAKFNIRDNRAAARSPITSAQEFGKTYQTHEGGTGYARNPKSELFLLAVTNMVGENTFYEDARTRDTRFAALAGSVAVADPEWMVGFIGWLRRGANMRSAALVAAAEGAKGRLDARQAGYSRKFVNAAMLRADEPGEMLAYWMSRYGRKIPKPVKRGVADAVQRLYTQRSLLKYDTGSRGYRFADVIDLVHPTPDPGKVWQGELFRYALDRRHGRDHMTGEDTVLTVIANNVRYRQQAASNPEILYDDVRTAAAAMTWEDVLSLAGPNVNKAKLWEAVIPSMGMMALARNLRNFDQAGVSDVIAATVAAKFTDPNEVARSRMLPMRWLSAYRAAPSLRWSYPLEQALNHSVNSIPRLKGRTLIMVDTSGSMNSTFSKDGTLMRWDAAALFGIALAQRCDTAEVVSFSGEGWGGWTVRDPANLTKVYPLISGESLLRSVERWQTGGYFLNGGTDTALALRRSYTNHDRVVILTDEQASHDTRTVNESVPDRVPMYTWNLAGYQYGHAPSGNAQRHTFGGLTDQAFSMIPLLEAGRDGTWPWEARND